MRTTERSHSDALFEAIIKDCLRSKRQSFNNCARKDSDVIVDFREKLFQLRETTMARASLFPDTTRFPNEFYANRVPRCSTVLEYNSRPFRSRIESSSGATRIQWITISKDSCSTCPKAFLGRN